MADLSAGQHANVVLQADEVLHVESDGNTDVVMLYGGPDGTTPVNSASLDFGPYGLPAKLRIDVNTGAVSYYLRTYEPTVASDEGVVLVSADDSALTVASKVATLNPEIFSNDPEGRGRDVKIPPGDIVSGPLSLSTMQSLKGVKGSSVPRFSPPAVGFGNGEYGHLSLLDDSVSNARGIRGQGVLEDLDINGDATAWAASYPGRIVHGYYAPARTGKCVGHTIRNVAFYDHNGCGVKLLAGNDQMVAERLRVENAWLEALYLDGASDFKGNDLGLKGKKAAARFMNCAPEINIFDFFIPDDFEGEATLHYDAANNCQLHNGTISGRTIIRGRNDQGTGVRYENPHHLFVGVKFKHEPNLNATRFYTGAEQIYVYDSYLELEDSDDVQLLTCKFDFDDTLSPSVLPDYLIKMTTSTGTAGRIGSAIITDASGFYGRVGRSGDATLPKMGCKKHWSNRPDLTIFSWGVPGQIEIVPVWAVNSADPEVRTHVRMDGVARLKADYPFGYLCATIATGGTLDDVNTAFTPELLPDISSNFCYAMRVKP